MLLTQLASYAANAFWFVLLLGILVLVHEFGHFAVAKLCGVYVETFSIGFGKRLFGIKYGDTDYRISLLPLGGYVKFAGDSPGEAPTGKVGEFNSHPRWQRVLIALAGPVANGLLAFGLFMTMQSFHHEVPLYTKGASVVDYVVHDSAADHAGIRSGDQITSFNKVQNPNWDDIMGQALVNSNDVIVPVSVLRNGQTVNLQLHIDARANLEKFDYEKMGLIPKEQDAPVQVKTTVAGLPAMQAGLQPDDQLVQVDALSLHSVSTLIAYLQDQHGQPAALTVLRSGQLVHLNIKPVLAPRENGEMSYQLGIEVVQPPFTVERLPLARAAGEAWQDTEKNSTLIVEVLRGLITRHVPLGSVSGPIGIFKITAQVSHMDGWWWKFLLMAQISLNLGIFNLLPIPILDGGVIVLLLIESVMRRDVNVEVKERIYQAAFVLLMMIFALVMFNDVSKLNLFHFKL
jgi:regulator of sigma E protease